MTNDNVKRVRLHIPNLQIDGPARNAQAADHTLVAKRDEGLQWAPSGDRLLKADLLRIVKINEREDVEAQPLQALLHRGADAVPGEILRTGNRVHLGGHHEALGHAPQLPNRLTDPPLALAPAVLVGGVNEVERAPEGPLDRGDRGLGVDLIALLGREAAESASSDADRGDVESGLSKWTCVHNCAFAGYGAVAPGSGDRAWRGGARPNEQLGLYEAARGWCPSSFH